MKIGITIGSVNVKHHLFFVNGMMQNIKFLYDLLESLGYEPFFLPLGETEKKDESGTPIANDDGMLSLNDGQYRYRTIKMLNESAEQVGIVLEVGITISSGDRHYLRDHHGAKIVVVRYGNSLVMDIQEFLFSDKQGFRNINDGADLVWYSPHFERAKTYLESVMGCPAYCSPYLWEPEFVKSGFDETSNSEEPPELVIMEPNIDVVKTAVIPLCIVNEVYLRDPNVFGKAWVLNAHQVRNKDFFKNNMVANLPVLPAEAEKVYFSDRAKFEDVFVKKRILVGHHWENELNYLYCEAVYKGVPLVHNSESMQEIGYYYPLCEVKEGANAVERAISNFHLDEDIHKNREFLERYSIHNHAVREKHVELIDLALARK